jgi:hypothetical protein
MRAEEALPAHGRARCLARPTRRGAGAAARRARRRAQVSPHEFMQAVMAASGKRFLIDRQADPVDFMSWFLNALHADLTGGKRKKPSVVTRCFQARPSFSPSLTPSHSAPFLDARRAGAGRRCAVRVVGLPRCTPSNNSFGGALHLAGGAAQPSA